MRRHEREEEDAARRGEFIEKWFLPYSPWMPINTRDPRHGLPMELKKILDEIQLEEMQKGTPPDDIDSILRFQRERLKPQMPPPRKPW